MDKLIAVSNTSSLIYLGKLEILNLAKNIFNKIIIPEEVINELFKNDYPENNYIKKELGNLIEIRKVSKYQNIPIDLGEKSAISLCLEKNIKVFISDDKKAREYAEKIGIKIIGVIGIIIYNLQKNKITKNQSKELIKKLIQAGCHISTELYLEIITLIEEHK